MEATKAAAFFVPSDSCALSLYGKRTPAQTSSSDVADAQGVRHASGKMKYPRLVRRIARAAITVAFVTLNKVQLLQHAARAVSGTRELPCAQHVAQLLGEKSLFSR